MRAERLADALDVGGRVHGREVVNQLARGLGAAPDERRVGPADRLELGGRGRAVEWRDDWRDGLGCAADRTTLPDAARVEGHHVPLAPKLVEMAPAAEVRAEVVANADARPAR